MNTTMTAYAAFGPDRIEKITLPVPEPDDYEVLVKNEGCVFCNTTDKMVIENLYATKDYPVLFGHENFGRVVKLGKKVKNFALGDRVICANAIVKGYNGECYSSWGGFAEYGIAGDLQAYREDGGIPQDKNRYRGRYYANCVIPGDFSYEKACLAFPLAEAASAVRQVGDLTGKTVVVIGTGIVGYFFTFFAKTYGAARVICLGRRQSRLEIAAKAGADETYIDVAEATAAIRRGGGAHVVFECSGNHRAMENGLPYLNENGLLATFAVPKEPYAIDVRKCPRVFSHQRLEPDVPAAIGEVCHLLRQDKVPVEVFLTHRWRFDQVPEGYAAVRRGDVVKGLVVIDPEPEEK